MCLDRSFLLVILRGGQFAEPPLRDKQVSHIRLKCVGGAYAGHPRSPELDQLKSAVHMQDIHINGYDDR